MNKIALKLGNQAVGIDAGELVSYQVDGHEFMHQKGNPGWRNVDTEMFPIIGPTNEADFKVETEKGTAIQDQHGLLREMYYTLSEQTETSSVFTKKYVANTEVKNSKYPDKSTEELLHWPYDFKFEKKFDLSASGLKITFTISGETGMPFMLGYHPAFMLHSKNATIATGNQEIDIPKVMSVGSRALQVPNLNSIKLVDEKSLQITTQGFTGFMLWTEVTNMVCIEPITFYPYAVQQENLAEGFQYLEDSSRSFSVELNPL